MILWWKPEKNILLFLKFDKAVDSKTYNIKRDPKDLKTIIWNKSLSQFKFSDYSEYILWSQKTELKDNLHYGWCTGKLFTASTRLNTSCSEIKINL